MQEPGYNDPCNFIQCCILIEHKGGKINLGLNKRTQKNKEKKRRILKKERKKGIQYNTKYLNT